MFWILICCSSLGEKIQQTAAATVCDSRSVAKSARTDRTSEVLMQNSQFPKSKQEVSDLLQEVDSSDMSPQSSSRSQRQDSGIQRPLPQENWPVWHCSAVKEWQMIGLESLKIQWAFLTKPVIFGDLYLSSYKKKKKSFPTWLWDGVRWK